MKTKRKLLLSILMIVFATFMVLSASACNLLSGSFALSDFIVDTSNVSLVYEVGDEVNLDGLSMKAFFNDGSERPVALSDVKIILGEEDISDNLNKITETEGTKSVQIVYESEYGTKGKVLNFTVNGETIILPIVDSFELPMFVTDYYSSIQNATDDDSATKFESNYFVNDDAIYVVGDDNAFKFLPVADDADMNVHTNVIVNTTVKIKVDTEYVELAKTLIPDSNYEYEYKYNDDVMFVEYAAENKFVFTEDAIGEIFAISVLPDETVYEFEDLVAIEFEFKVVDGYNVYTADELCLIDNMNRIEWASKKAALGLTNVQTNGIILHSTLSVTKANIPEAFMYTLPDSYNIEYKLIKDGKTYTGSPEYLSDPELKLDLYLDRTFIWDAYKAKDTNVLETERLSIYSRKIADGESFAIYGNYFSIDLSKMPLSASFEAGAAKPDTAESVEGWYKPDFSNTSFINVYGNTNTVDGADETCLFENFAVRGNAGTDYLVVTSNTKGYQAESGETLVFCGGTAFTKMGYITSEVKNVRVYECFTAFVNIDYENVGCAMSFDKTKVYDSASSAFFGWGVVNATVNQSYWKRSGGPLVLLQNHDYRNGSVGANFVINDNCVFESYVGGSEPWFQSVGATGIIAQLKAIDDIWNMINKTMLKDGKMNLMVLIMSNGVNPKEVLTAYDVQGYASYGDTVLDRVIDPTNPLKFGTMAYGIADDASKGGVFPPVFNFGLKGGLYYYTGNPAAQDPSLMGYGILDPLKKDDFDPNDYTTWNNGAEAMGAAANKANSFAMNYGGFGMILGLYDRITQN